MKRILPIIALLFVSCATSIGTIQTPYNNISYKEPTFLELDTKNSYKFLNPIDQTLGRVTIRRVYASDTKLLGIQHIVTRGEFDPSWFETAVNREISRKFWIDGPKTIKNHDTGISFCAIEAAWTQPTGDPNHYRPTVFTRTMYVYYGDETHSGIVNVKCTTMPRFGLKSYSEYEDIVTSLRVE